MVVDRRFIARLLEELAEQVRLSTRCRNLLVHRYWSVDADRVWAAVGENLGDFRLFAEAVERFLGANPEV